MYKRQIMVSGRRNTRSLLLSYSYLSACAGTLLRLCALPVHALRQDIIFILIAIVAFRRVQLMFQVISSIFRRFQAPRRWQAIGLVSGVFK